jgi:hypothetical protein
MIHDIKVFDKHGNLKEIVDGQKYFAKLYEQSAKSFIMERKKTKGTFICKFCRESFPSSSPSQFCCNKGKCRYQRGLMIKPLKGGRDIVCRICSKKATVRHSRAVTCGKECSKELNRKKNLAHGLAFRKNQTDNDRKARNARDREIRAEKRKAVQGKGNNGKKDQTVKQ